MSEEERRRDEQGGWGVAEQDVEVLLPLRDHDVEGTTVDDRLDELAQVGALGRGSQPVEEGNAEEERSTGRGQDQAAPARSWRCRDGQHR